MLVSSWDNRRDKGTWEEEEVRPGGAAETKVEVAEGKEGTLQDGFTLFRFCKVCMSERPEGTFPSLVFPSSVLWGAME